MGDRIFSAIIIEHGRLSCFCEHFAISMVFLAEMISRLVFNCYAGISCYEKLNEVR